MKTIKSAFLVIIILLSIQSLGQVKSIGLPNIKNYNKTEYKGATQNWNIDQDSNGNIYFANNNGLLQFDGVTWVNYPLPYQAVRSLKVAPNGTIYVGGFNEFGYFKANTKGTLEYYSLLKLIKRKGIDNIQHIWKIHLYNDEVIFQAFNASYVYKNNKIFTLKAPNRFQFSFKVNNNLYFQDMKLGILQYKDGKLIPLKETSSLNNTEIWGMFNISEDKLLIATLDKGIFLYANSKLTSWNTEANTFAKKNSCLGGTKIKGNYIVLNTILNGIIVCDKNGKIVQHINRRKGLQNNTILTSFIDKNNNLWLGLDNGISIINENSPFSYFGESYNLGTVYGTVVHNNYLYVATNQGLFYHKWDTSFKEDSFSLVEGTTGQAWNIQVIDNQLLCAHNRGALLIVGGKAIKTMDVGGYWGFKKIPNNPDYLIGSNYNGMAIFHKTASGWVFLNKIEGYNGSSTIFEIDKNYVWLKNSKDLLCQMKMNQDHNKFTYIKKYANLSNTIKGIGSIQNLNNKIYFQSKNHFFNYSNSTNKFIEDVSITNLFKTIPIINFSSQDNFGNIWYSFNESLGVLMNMKNGNYKNIIAPFKSQEKNLVKNYLSIYTINPENILIGLNDGLAHYNLKLSKNYLTKPKALIRNFEFLNDTLILGNGQKESKEYKIPYASNHVKFTFSSPTYENNENIEFSYKLEGFDKVWSKWSKISLKEYTNLREDNYKMKVKVRNSYGITSDEAIVTFTISPPWYRHPVSYFFYILTAAFVIYFIRIYVKTKIRKNKYLETIEQRRIYLEKETVIKLEQIELEKEIERLEKEKLQINILSKDKELVTNTLQVAKKNKVLNGIIHKLKDINVDALDESTRNQFTKLNKSITKEVKTDKSWNDLEKHIKNVHFDFLKRLKEKHPTISPRELDLSTYLLMNMSTKEIAEIMNISGGGVELARYRLRKKLELNKKENLIGFLMSI